MNSLDEIRLIGFETEQGNNGRKALCISCLLPFDIISFLHSDICTMEFGDENVVVTQYENLSTNKKTHTSIIVRDIILSDFVLEHNCYEDLFVFSWSPKKVPSQGDDNNLPTTRICICRHLSRSISIRIFRRINSLRSFAMFGTMVNILAASYHG